MSPLQRQPKWHIDFRLVTQQLCLLRQATLVELKETTVRMLRKTNAEVAKANLRKGGEGQPGKVWQIGRV
eukprot:3291093-Karenia_brevis.AAC.1